jgi:hypothetical protein
LILCGRFSFGEKIESDQRAGRRREAEKTQTSVGDVPMR